MPGNSNDPVDVDLGHFPVGLIVLRSKDGPETVAQKAPRFGDLWEDEA